MGMCREGCRSWSPGRHFHIIQGPHPLPRLLTFGVCIVPPLCRSMAHDGAATVLVRTLDLAALVQTVASHLRAGTPGGGEGRHLVMKLDVEGSEYTVLPHLALRGALCQIDLLMIEYHARYFDGKAAKRVAEHSNLTERTSGRAALERYIARMHAGLELTALACARTRLLLVDDESFLWDHRPWPVPDTLCRNSNLRRAQPTAASLSASHGLLVTFSMWIRRWWLIWVAVHDAFEDKGMLPVLFGTLAILCAILGFLTQLCFEARLCIAPVPAIYPCSQRMRRRY